MNEDWSKARIITAACQTSSTRVSHPIYWRLVNASNGNRKSCGKWGGAAARSMIPFIRRWVNDIRWAIIRWRGVTLVFTDPDRGDKSTRLPRRIPKLYLIETSSRCRLLSGIRYSIKLPDRSARRFNRPSFPRPSPPEFGQGLTWLDGGGCRCTVSRIRAWVREHDYLEDINGLFENYIFI